MKIEALDSRVPSVMNCLGQKLGEAVLYEVLKGLERSMEFFPNSRPGPTKRW